MDRQKLRHAMMQTITAVVAITMLFAGVMMAFWIIAGPSGLPVLSSLKDKALADAEISQLVGSPAYTRPQERQHHSLLESLNTNFQFPLASPISMLDAQLPKTDIQVAKQTNTQSSLFQSIGTWAVDSHKVALGWLPSTSTSASIQMLQENPGINVVSPVWFHLNDASGNLSGQVLPGVVSYAHQHHIRVWVLVDNHFSSKLTHQVLQNPKAVANLIDELVYQAKLYHLDGFNIDFENVAAADRDAFTSFIKSLHDKLAPLHINESVDVSPDIVQLRDDQAFFHAALASAADELVLMAYDEHWGTDQNPGPVADVPWVTKSVNDLLDTGVPTAKLVVGMPFYTRFWYVHKDGHVTNEAVSDGNIDGILQKHQATSQWNKALGLMYARYPEPDGYMEVWYPTTQTLQEKLALVGDNGLAGVAVWSLVLSDTATWTSLVDALRTAGS